MTEPQPSGAGTALPNDDDIAATAPNTTVRSATLSLMLTGFTTLLLGLQLVTSLRFHSALLQASLYAMIVIGAFAMYVGVRLFRMQAWAAVACAALGTALTIAMSAWLVFSFSQGLFTLFALWAPPLAFAAAVLGFKSIPAARRATEVRERLQDGGIELGF